MKRLAALFALALPACSGQDSTSEAEVPRISAPLTAEAQQARFAACSARLAHYRDMGVVAHGGAKPGVDPAAWGALKPAQQAEIFDIAACIASGGATGPREVTIGQAGGGLDVETRRVANDRDFAG